MKSLLLMRHAKSSWKDSFLSDHERPLNARGKRDAPRMGLLLMDKELNPDTILCSTANRARSTVKHLLETCDFSGQIRYLEDLYHADYVTYLDFLSDLPDDSNRAMIVGHNPEMNQFLHVVCEEYDHMPTAAIALIEFPCEKWSDINENAEGKLIEIWKPREIDG